jgi:type II secretory pathway pseudopilin PulG
MPPARPRRHDPSRRAGTTLVELLVVAGVLVALAGLLIGTLGGVHDAGVSGVTAETLVTLRDAILGRADAGQASGYLADTGALPAQLSDLFIRPDAIAPFEPAIGLGWHGPYLRTSTGNYDINPGMGFTAAYGSPGEPAVLDAWGEPVVLQLPDPDDSGLHARLVSAGPDHEIQTPPDLLYPSKAACEDDVVLYLRVPDLRL